MTSLSQDRRNGVLGVPGVAAPCVAASTANLTLSGEQTINGIACVTDDRVLVKNQTTASSNGIYIVDTGEWTRAKDFDGNFDFVRGTLVNVTQGTSVGKGLWQVSSTAAPHTVGTDDITFASVLLTT